MQDTGLLAPPVRVRVIEKKSQKVMVLTLVCIVNAIICFAMCLYLIGRGVLDLGFIGLLCDGPWLFLGVMFLLVGVGLRMMKRWAWIMAIVFGILSLVYTILNIVFMSDADIEGYPIVFTSLLAASLAVNVVVVVLAWIVRDRFKKEPYHLPWMPPVPMM